MRGNIHRKLESVAAIEAAMREYVRDKGEAGVMPTESELRYHGELDLDKALNALQCRQEIAASLGLALSSSQVPDSNVDWSDFANVKREVHAVRTRLDLQRMPTQVELKEHGPPGLYQGLLKYHDGLGAVAAELSLQRATGNIDWSDFGNVEREVHAVRTSLDLQGMPTQAELIEHGASGMCSGLHKHHDGHGAVAAKLDLQTVYSNIDWANFANVEREVHAVRTRLELERMPTATELHQHGPPGLYAGLLKHHDGLKAIARKLR